MRPKPEAVTVHAISLTMKSFIKIITHPILIIALFSFLLISGEENGGFYLFYLLLGLPHFALHSVLGILGIICLLITHYKKSSVSLLRVLGAFFMVVSLLWFFLQPNGSYNYDTFHSALPLILLVIFGVLIIIFICYNFSSLVPNTGKKGHHFT